MGKKKKKKKKKKRNHSHRLSIPHISLNASWKPLEKTEIFQEFIYKNII